MKKTRLLAMLEAVRARVPLEHPLVVGSQSAHALDGAETPAVEASLEVDLLLIGRQFQHRSIINEEFGEQSAFFRQNGTYVHAIGIGIVSLPAGWESRLQPIVDATGRGIAQAVEIHDTLAAKLMAGREKDLEFVHEMIERNLCDFATFVQRFLLLRSSAFANAVPDRLAKLVRHLREWQRDDLAQTVQAISRSSADGSSARGMELHEEPPDYRTPANRSPAEPSLVANLVADGLNIQEKFRPEPLSRQTGQGQSEGKAVPSILSELEAKHRQLQQLCRRANVVLLDLFGSAASGEFRPAVSDLDFVVTFGEFPHGGIFDAYMDLAEGLEALFDRKVDLVTDRSIRNPYFRKAVESTRIRIYERRDPQAPV